MKKREQKQAIKRLINHYSAWKYVVLITTIIILTLSAIPTWYGEQPSIQLQTKDASSVLRNVPELAQILNKQNLTADEITQKGDKTTLVFANESQQSQARNVLDSLVKEGDTITYSYVSVAPKWLDDLGFSPIKLGLDLRGGVQFLLNVDVDKAFQEQRESMIDAVKDSLRTERLRGVSIVAFGNDGFEVKAEQPQALTHVRKYLQENYRGWDIRQGSDHLQVQPSQQNKTEFQTATIQQNLKIMRDRIEELGITEALVQRQGEHAIRIELPGVQDPITS